VSEKKVGEKCLVMLPGFMGTKTDFNTLSLLLGEQFECMPLVLGEQPVTEQRSVSAEGDPFEEAVNQWFQQFHMQLPESFYLYGYSMGGRMALALASQMQQQQPGRIKGLFLESAHPGLQSDTEKKRRQQGDECWVTALKERPLNDVLRDWYAQPVFSGLQEAQVEQLIASKAHLNAAILQEQLQIFGLSQQRDYRSFLHQATVKHGLTVHFFAGGKDEKFRQLGAGLRGPQLHIAEHCGHNIHFEDARWMANAIQSTIEH